MVRKYGATIRVYPVDFGTIFPASGGLPLPKRAPQRQAYRLQELARWREAVGEPIQIHPKFFPAIGALPYLLTFGPHGFYWFLLTDGSQPES